MDNSHLPEILIIALIVIAAIIGITIFVVVDMADGELLGTIVPTAISIADP